MGDTDMTMEDLRDWQELPNDDALYDAKVLIGDKLYTIFAYDRASREDEPRYHAQADDGELVEIAGAENIRLARDNARRMLDMQANEAYQAPSEREGISPGRPKRGNIEMENPEEGGGEGGKQRKMRSLLALRAGHRRWRFCTR